MNTLIDWRKKKTRNWTGSWTYGGLEVDLKHKDALKQKEESETVMGTEGEHLETVWVVEEGT